MAGPSISQLRQRAPWLVLGAVAVGGSSVAVAGAAVSAEPESRIHACVTSEFGTLNVTTADAPCLPGQRKISWNGDGRRGPLGRRGRAGLRGADGPIGPTGAGGAAGPKGAAGAVGPAGAAGPAGSAGAVGPAGAVGATGAVGARGAAGADGARGATGARGSTGAAGAAGAIGFRGFPGTPGLPGIPGLDGRDGAVGGTGLAGRDGVAGRDGATGPAGRDGATGARGAAGTAGAQGPAGPDGQPGANGADGADAPADYAFLYNEGAQSVKDGEAVLFDGTDVRSPTIGHKDATDVIDVRVAGVYEIHFSVVGDEPNQFGLLVNEEIAPGTTFGSGGGQQPTVGFAFVALHADDRLRLVSRNGTTDVQLAASIGGKSATVNASLTLRRLPDVDPKAKEKLERGLG